MLETFDGAARPVAVQYTPFSLVSPSAIPPLFSLSAVPGQRLARQPLRVLLNARFRLPAGEYEVEVEGADAAGNATNGTLDLQIGREGAPMQNWPFSVSPGSRWRQRFRIPVDAEFVGFRASPEVERAIGELRVRALEVVDAGRRPRTDAVRSAAVFDSATVFFHDGGAYVESGGFWVKGHATTRATIMKATPGAESITLNLHSEARPNIVTLTTTDWSERIQLIPGVMRAVVVPSDQRDLFIPVQITSSNGFVPAEIHPGNTDKRVLGCWIELTR